MRPHSLIGMVHVGALPGTPRCSAPLPAVVAAADREARTLLDAGIDALLVENMHDRPYLRGTVGPEIVAAMTRAGVAVRAAAGDGVPLGVQVLAGANEAALAVALACDAQFVRVEGFVFASVADEGLFDEAAAGSLLRYRRAIGASSIQVFCDIKKKHSSHAITADLDLAATAEAAAFCGADGVVVTGTATGRPTPPGDVAAVRAAMANFPVLVGSGVTPENLDQLLPHADALIVGSAIKRGGRWDQPIDPERVRRLVDAAEAWRRQHG